MRNGSTKVLPLLLCGALTALAIAAAPVASRAESGEALIAEGPAPDLLLLYTGDVIGYLGPCG